VEIIFLLKQLRGIYMHKKVVVITGASSGIGKALAEKYADEGWNLVWLPAGMTV
jgi:NADP-dependent 3-hydroxy acid dehydrogenase YdfG